MRPMVRYLPALGLLALLVAPYEIVEAGRGGSRGAGGSGARVSSRASAPARSGGTARAHTSSRSSAAPRSTAAPRASRPSPYASNGRSASTSASRTPSGGAPTTARGKATYGYGGYYGGYYPPHYYPGYSYPYYYPYSSYYYPASYPCYWNGWDWAYGGWYGYPSFSATVVVSGGGYAGGGGYSESASDSVPSAPPATIETQVQPKKAEVWIDGALRGEARDFNGTWDALTIPAGEHLIEFRHDGHSTLRIHLRAEPGVRYVIAEDLPEGSSVIERGSPLAAQDPVERAAAAPRADPEPSDAGTLRRGLLKISVTPQDAAVYLDGEFLASADALGRLHGALPVAVGTHVLEVTRPGYESERRDVVVDSGGRAEVEFVLARAGAR